MAAIILLRNPLQPHTREVFALPAGTRVIDWLQEHHPTGFGMPCRFFLDGAEKPLDDLDHALGDDETAVIALMPAAPGALLGLALNLAVSLVLAGVSYLLGQLFQPKQRSGAKGGAVTVYDVSSDQNAARLGDPIPVVYGAVLTTPDYVSQPYTFYTWSQRNFDELFNGIQYLDMILCVGQGNIDVESVYLGDTRSTVPDAGVVTWKAFKPADHQKTMGVIAASMGGGFHENVISSPEVSNQEFSEAGHSAGYFITCKRGQKGSKFQIDVTFPGGLTDPDSSGDIKGRQCIFNVFYQQVDDNDNRFGTETSVQIRCDSRSGWLITGPNLESSGFAGTPNEKNRSMISAPLRRTYTFQAPSSARWAVKIVRQTAAPNAKNGASTFIWTGLRLFADYPAMPVYGNVTLLAVRIKASKGMGNDASGRISVKCTRRLQQPGGGAEAPSTNAADAFADAYTDATYGANRPRGELDIATLATLRTRWSAYQFNHIFRDRVTVWDALRTITTPFAAEPAPLGATMSAVQDGIKPVRSMLFTDANIVAGSLTVNYSFDEEGASDGVEIEYLDPKDFKQNYTRWPTTSLRPDQFTLPGVTDATHAGEYARLTWQRRLGQRKRVQFDTELEGLIVQIGDRIGIAHNVPKWGDSGLVIGVSGLNVTVDHDLDWSGGAKQIMFRKPDGGVTDPVTVTRGGADNIVVLPGAAGTTLNYDNDYDYTSFAFGNATALVRDFIVTGTTPADNNTVTVEAMNYAPSIFTGGMSFL